MRFAKAFGVAILLVACSLPEKGRGEVVKDPYPLNETHLCEPSEQGESKQVALDLFQKAKGLRVKRDDQNAIPIWRNIVEIDPNFTCAIYELAQAYRRIGEYDEAIYHYNSAIEKGPSPWYYFYSRGAAKNLAGYHQDAIVDLSSAIALSPEETTIYDLRADSKMKLKNYTGAFKDIELAIAKGGLYPSVLKTRGILYAMQQEWDLACRDWKLVIGSYDYSAEHESASILLEEYCYPFED